MYGTSMEMNTNRCRGSRTGASVCQQCADCVCANVLMCPALKSARVLSICQLGAGINNS